MAPVTVFRPFGGPKDSIRSTREWVVLTRFDVVQVASRLLGLLDALSPGYQAGAFLATNDHLDERRSHDLRPSFLVMTASLAMPKKSDGCFSIREGFRTTTIPPTG